MRYHYPLQRFTILWATLLLFTFPAAAQLLQLPDGGVNIACMTGRKIGVTEIEIKWNAPGVKGREGKIWGTTVAPFGYTVLGYGSTAPSPWRAGANESTSISFSTEVGINGKKLPAGKYGFFIALYPDSCVLIFNQNSKAWGSYFYNAQLDVLHVSTTQQKNQPDTRERLNYTFTKETASTVEVALEWEKWRIPFTVTTDLAATTLASIRTQLSGAMGFDPPSLEAAAAWCLQQQTNYEEALGWINSATDANLGNNQSFRALSVKAGLLKKLNKGKEADTVMKGALERATVFEMHAYGRQLQSEQQYQQAMEVFTANYKKHQGAWPTNVGMMRGYSGINQLKKALEHARLALPQAPNKENKQVIENAIATLSAGKPL